MKCSPSQAFYGFLSVVYLASGAGLHAPAVNLLIAACYVGLAFGRRH